MQQGRRTNDRRRRVLYSAQQAENGPKSAASRREAEKLREARCPQMAYGSRVHRRIRGRWFSLVPIRLRSMLLVTGSIFLLTATLCIAHYTAVTWTPLSNRPMIARPLRLDRPDSFGRWCMVAMLAVTAGIALMTYQLRRYRNDDFGGHYRLWRIVIVVSVLASINALVSLVDWSGAIIDAGFGKRVALAGNDWVRLVVTFGGAVLALRMVAELWHCRTALILMLTSCILFVIPEAVQWNILKIESAGYWTLATTAPMLGCTTLLIAMLTYLRVLYREVKQIEGPSIMERLHQIRLRLPQSEDKIDEETSTPNVGMFAETTTKRRWWQRSEKDSHDRSKTDPEQPATETAQESTKKRSTAKKQKLAPLPEKQAAVKQAAVKQAAVKENIDQSQETDPPEGKRRWFGLRGPKASASEAAIDSESEAVVPHTEESENKQPRSSSRSKSKSATRDMNEAEGTSGTEPGQREEKASRKGLMGWRRKKDAEQAEEIDTSGSHQADGEEQRNPDGNKSAPRQNSNESEEDLVETDDIDWNSMSKAQRRRLRKQLKRQQNAA